MVGTCQFAVAAAPNGDEDDFGGDGADSSSRRRRRNHLLLRGGDSSVVTMPKQEQPQHQFAIPLQNNSDGETSTAAPCTQHSCANGIYCTLGSDRCNRILSQICGCDGITYSNTCEAFKVGVNVAHSGACVAEDGMIITGGSSSVFVFSGRVNGLGIK